MIARRTPIKRTALKRRPRKKRATDNPEYLAWVHSWTCWVCLMQFCKSFEISDPRECRDGIFRKGRTEAAHVGIRGLGQKCADKDSMPLCGAHHRTGALSAHVLGKRFWEVHGIDRSKVLTYLHAAYRLETGNDL
jgi:hypothetical protein